MPNLENSPPIEFVHNYSLNPETREIFVSASADDLSDAEINHKTSDQFIKNLRLLENVSDKPILVHSIIGGGDINFGLAIYDSIKLSTCHITVLIHGLASSMSGIFPQAADLRIITPRAHFFLHNIECSTNGNVNVINSDISQWRRDSSTIYEIFAERCQNGSYFLERRYSKSKVKAFLKRKSEAGLYLSPAEALEYGLVDGILGEEPYLSVNSLLS